MPTVLPTIDLSPIRAAVDANDAATVERIATELGIELSHATLTEYLREFEPHDPSGIASEAFRLFYAALHDPAGHALTIKQLLALLVVRHGDRLIFGVQRCESYSAPFPKSGWKIGRWFKDPARNRATVEAWAADPTRATDALGFRIIHAPTQTAATDDRGEMLLAAVTANPDDDGARLVYADWLAEQGDARGELIRVQCELAGSRQYWQQTALLEREQALLSSVRPAMEAALGHFTEHFQIRRGLVEVVTLFAGKLVKYGPELVRQHPIRRLRILCNGAHELARLATLPWLARVPELEIESRKTPKIIHSRAVMKPTSVPALFANTRRLELADLDDKPTEWHAWLTAVEAPLLEALRLIRLDLDLPTYELFADPTVLPALRCLEVAHPKFAQTVTRDRDRLIAAVWTIAQRRALEEYRFTSWHIDDVVLARCIRDMLRCKTLTRLAIDNCSKAGTATGEALAAGGDRVVHLQITGAAKLVADAIAALPNLESLSCLVRGDSRLVIEAIEASMSIKRVHWPDLAEHERPRLDHLELRYTFAT